MFALPISMPGFKSIIFYFNSPKIKLFLRKKAKFSSTPPPDPCVSGGWGLRPQTPNGLWQPGAKPPDPQHSYPIANFWLRAYLYLILAKSTLQFLAKIFFFWCLFNFGDGIT